MEKCLKEIVMSYVICFSNKNVNQNMRGKLPVGPRFRITAWTPVTSYNSSDGELYDRRTVVESKQLSVSIHEERNGNITINISLHLTSYLV